MLQFADESAAVSAEMRARIAASALALLQALEEEPELQISVAALPEDMREDPFPHPMSLARAQSVKEELVRNGVPASLIEVLRANSATHETARHEQPHVLIAAEPRVLLPRKGQGR
ncbi:MAG TPA: hypothetical protein VG937_10580 [Polyangiaceae bacterium]|nr:hypothetical protein [Polyangiaceae bacterium]